MLAERGITAARINSNLKGKSSFIVYLNGTRYPSGVEAFVPIDGAGGGSHDQGVTYDSYGALMKVEHVEQNGMGNNYSFFDIDTTTFAKIQANWRFHITALSGRGAIGIIPYATADSTPGGIVAGLSAGQKIIDVYPGAVEIGSLTTDRSSPLNSYLDLTNYQGHYWLYFEAICTDNTSSSKAAWTYVYNVIMAV